MKFFSIIFLLRFVIADKWLYELTDEDPAYAFHGVRLRRLDNLTLSTTWPVTFLIDLSKRSCDDEPKSSIALKAITYCNDPLPFSINQEVVDLICNDLTPSNSDLTEYFYSCSLAIHNSSQLVFQALVGGSNDEYGVSIRVKEWVNASKNVLVIPISRDAGLTGIALIKANTMGIMIEHPDLIKSYKGPLIDLEGCILGKNDDLDQQCQNLMNDVTCSRLTQVFVYSGGAPSAKNSTKYLLKGGTFQGPNMNFFSMIVYQTISTLITEEACSFAITYKVNTIPDNSTSYSLEDLPVLTSFDYPWLFGNSEEYTDCWTSVRNTMGNSHKNYYRLSVDSIRGGTLRITVKGAWFFKEAQLPIFDDDPYERLCYYGALMLDENVTEPISYDIEAACFLLTWCPDPEDIGPTGFLLSTDFIGHVGGCTLDVSSFELTAENPLLVLHGYDILLYFGSAGTGACISTPDCSNCSLLVNIVGYCDEKAMKCEITPFIVNGRPFSNEGCRKGYRELNKATFFDCQIVTINTVVIEIDLSEMNGKLYRSSISIRVLEWMDGSFDYRLEPLDDNNEIRLVFEANPRPTWLSLAISTMDQQRQLSKFRWDHHPAISCEYLLVDGPPDGHLTNSSRKLTVLRDTDRFIPLTVESNAISLLIPQGCRPSIILDTSDSLSQSLAHNLSEELCEGTAIVVTPNYNDIFFTYVSYDSLSNYYYCGVSLINISIEVVQITGGAVFIEYFDGNNESQGLTNIPPEIDPNDPLLARSQVRGVSLYINKTINLLPSGCLLKIHVKKKGFEFKNHSNARQTNEASRKIRLLLSPVQCFFVSLSLSFFNI